MNFLVDQYLAANKRDKNGKVIGYVDENGNIIGNKNGLENYFAYAVFS